MIGPRYELGIKLSVEDGPCSREAVYLHVTVGSPSKICCELTDAFILMTMSSAKSIEAETIVARAMSGVFIFCTFS